MASKWSFKELFWRSAAPGSAVDGEGEHAAPASGTTPRAGGVDAHLTTLRDIQGVVGSLAIGTDGAIWGRDLPRTFDDDSAQRLAQRLAQLHDALTSDGDEFDAAALRYQGYRFHIARAVPGLIGVLTQEQVNLPALTMAMRLVAKKVVNPRELA
jgi:predicted regulator of Ras-like GTPase activity (Roadblock/LC7/MglB family)